MPNATDEKVRNIQVDERLQMLPYFIKHNATDKHFYMDFHSHAGYEIYFFQQGAGNFLIEDRIFPLEGHDILFISEHESHKSSPNMGVDCSRSVINFLPELLLPSAKELFLGLFAAGPELANRHIRVAGEQWSRINALLDRLSEITYVKLPHFRISFSICLNELLMELYRLVHTGTADHVMPISRKSINPKIEQIVRHLTEHFSRPMSLKELADMIYVNPYYLCHLFKETTGVTISDFLIYTRIRQAKKELTLTDLSIAEIAGRVGFNTQAHFGQTFKMMEGVTPRDYRKKHQT